VGTSNPTQNFLITIFDPIPFLPYNSFSPHPFHYLLVLRLRMTGLNEGRKNERKKERKNERKKRKKE
jgi:hypothetical protein